MTKAEVFGKISSIIVDMMGCDPEGVTAEADWNTLGCDSLDHVELIMAAEEEFEVEIPDEDAEKVLTVGAAAAYICERLGITE